MAEEHEIVGKKKRVIDESAYFNAKRSGSDFTILHQSLGSEMHGGTYFKSSPAVDKLRVVTATNWDYHPNYAGYGTDFNNSFIKFKSFRKQAIEFHPPLNGESDGYDDSGQEGCSAPWEDSENPLILHQTIVIKSDPVLQADIEVYTDAAGTDPSILDWTAFIKAGLEGSPGSDSYSPIIKADHYFYDHYHSTFVPFTPMELEKKQPSGKAYYADYKTYYNERLDSKSFESALATRTKINKSIPNIYGFIRLAKNDLLAKDENFELTKLLEFMNHWRSPHYEDYPIHHESSKAYTRNDVYTTLFQKYPLEAAILLYGALCRSKIGFPTLPPHTVTPNQIIENIINLDFSKHDASALFENYFRKFAEMITAGSASESQGFPFPDQYSGTTAAVNTIERRRRITKMMSLERILSKIALSPNFIPIMKKVDQYKKHFPYYVDLQFTAKRLTSIGDFMKDVFMTRFMSYKVLASKLSATDFYQYRYGIQDDWLPGGNNSSDSLRFIDFSEEKIYKDIKYMELDYDEHTLNPPAAKRTLNLEKVLNDFVSTDNDFQDLATEYHKAALTSVAGELSTVAEEFYGDIRNYVTFVRDDLQDPVNLINDDNTIFRVLCGTAFKTKILEIYKNNRRSYFDILRGKPAYTEDIFYRILKYRKDRDPDAEWVPFQEILIPNTSELDIARYVDTQLKYSDEATYKYEVYTLRATFGSKYKYRWGKSTVDPDGPGFDYESHGQNYGMSSYSDIHAPLNGAIFSNDFEDLQTGLTITENASKLNFIAKILVTVEPSIQIIEDKLFSTPEVFIMDRPPMPPDVNIVPYRAVGDRLKFIFTGTTGRIKEKPVVILNSDKEKFDLVKKAQLVFPPLGSDDITEPSVEFANDDPVTSFQIFRIRKKPNTYQDFELYKESVPPVFEESLLPNTKYYYMFRSIDAHGHISNPSPIYEVELIDENGAVKPLIRLFNFEPAWPKTYMRECQKYIYIKPNLKQLYFSEDEQVDGIFSTESKKKKYKMRLTSKGSGKKIDINFSYQKKIDEDQ